MRYSTSIRKSLLYDLGKSNKWIDLQESIKLLADYFDVHFFLKYHIYIWCLYAQNSNPTKSINKTNQNYKNISVWEKCWSQELFKRPNLRPGQLLKPGQKFVCGQVWGQNWGQANFEARPGQWRQARTGLVL